MHVRVHSKKSTLTFGTYQSQTSDKLLANVAYLFGFPHYHQANDRAVPTNSPEPHSSKFVTNDHFFNSCFILIYQRKISVGNSTPSLLQKSCISYLPFSQLLFVPFKCPQYVGAQFRGCLVINMLSDTEMNIIWVLKCPQSEVAWWLMPSDTDSNYIIWEYCHPHGKESLPLHLIKRHAKKICEAVELQLYHS